MPFNSGRLSNVLLVVSFEGDITYDHLLTLNKMESQFGGNNLRLHHRNILVLVLVRFMKVSHLNIGGEYNSTVLRLTECNC